MRREDTLAGRRPYLDSQLSIFILFSRKYPTRDSPME